MDPITHAAAGALAGSAVRRLLRLQRQPESNDPTIGRLDISQNQALFIGALAGLLPDMDILSYVISPLHYHAYWHGTYTHSLLLAPLWAGLFALLLIVIQRGLCSARARPSFSIIYWIGLAGIFSHIALDLITAWDVGIWLPLSQERVSFGLIFLVDLIFSASILLGLWAVYRQWKPWILICSLTFAMAWLGFAYVQKQEAIQIAHKTHPNLPQQLAAWPQPFSVFHWKLVTGGHDGFWQAHVRISNRAPLQWPLPLIQDTVDGFTPPHNLHWQFYPTAPNADAKRAWEHPAFSPVRDFKTYPIFMEQDALGCVWFTDLLYVIPEQTPPFVYGFCEHPDGRFTVERKPSVNLFNRRSIAR
ncbi:metal-dependent hydrolase [Aliidiomarina halalkaliphila]|uniref:Metal-dependent hydrolase n=1 Tax=Aliidiomarina halalkaliphila TaxID=2593535 RepID=A0A552X155_9GAMM|nr:metal-dependent hydrolase [Aliidiomarina halalkaliphila]TRW48695.1 metal-dependent hydrolase [Aliidiomarina halalkaliphila]